MEDQDTSQLTTYNKDSSSLILNETKTTEEKTTCKNSTEQQALEVYSEVYSETGTGNEVITIITEETDGEVYIYDRNDIENATTEIPVEYIEVCDSNNAYEEVNVVGIEEEEEDKLKEKKMVGKDEIKEAEKDKDHQKLEDPKECMIGEGSQGSQSKNFKNVILEDWDVDVPQTVQNHESEATITCSNENDTEVIEVEQVVQTNDENSQVKKENEKEKNAVNGPKEKSKNITSNCKNLRKANSQTSQNERLEKNSDPVKNSKEENSSQEFVAPQLVERMLKCTKTVTKEDIVKILDDSSERVVRPIVGGKDLFFSIELTKRINQNLGHGKNSVSEAREKNNKSETCNNNNTVDDRQKIVEILEADEIKDWKSTPSKSDSGPKENGNDMEISEAIKRMEAIDSKATANTKTKRRPHSKKVKTMDKEMERMLALQQLREEFPNTRKRTRTSKKVNHVPFLASTVLEKAMSSPEVTTALKPEPPKRRPCYLPENVTYPKSKENAAAANSGTNAETSVNINTNATKSNSDLGGSDFTVPGESVANPVVKTYSVKRKSTDAENDIKTTLEAVAKALNERSEETSESKPKKQKTVANENKNKKMLIKKKRKLKPGVKSEKKMKSELEKLLGDEGAVRMLYDTQHADTSSSTPKRTKFKTTTGLKKDLVLKTKLVKSAVMRLSWVRADGVVLRGKRRPNFSKSATMEQDEEPLFTSTPNIVLYKPKKKQRAEASRILYRHSSSESFDSSEGYRRTSFDADGLNAEPANRTQTEEATGGGTAEKVLTKGRSTKSEILKKRLKKVRQKKPATKEDKGSTERLSTDSIAANSSKLNLSNVPVRKSSRPRVVSKKYSIWSSTSMDSLSVESLGLKKLKKASTELGKKLNCKELTIMQYEHLVQIILSPTTTLMKNSLNYEVFQDLLHVFSYLSKDENCRVVLLSSSGTHFCQGVDINGIISFSESEKKKGVSQLVKAIMDFVTCLASFKKPVIAGVQGAAIGLGVTLLPYCDLIISSDTASFYTPYVKLGQAPEGAPIQTFPLINRQLVSELLFKSHKMTAADALKYGLVTQVVPAERFEEDLIMISRNMASQPPQGLQSIKMLLRRSEQWDVSRALQAECELLEEHWNSTECLNNMIKFLNSGELQLKQTTVG